MKKILLIVATLVFSLSFAQEEGACTPEEFVMPEGSEYAVHFLNNEGDCLSFPVYFNGLPDRRVGTFFFDDEGHVLHMQKNNAELGNELGNLIALGDGMITIMYDQRGLSLAWALQALECSGDGPALVLGYYGWPDRKHVSLEELKEVCPEMYIIPRPPR